MDERASIVNWNKSNTRKHAYTQPEHPMNENRDEEKKKRHARPEISEIAYHMAAFYVQYPNRVPNHDSIIYLNDVQ